MESEPEKVRPAGAVGINCQPVWCNKRTIRMQDYTLPSADKFWEDKMENKDWNTGDYWCCEQHPDKPFPHYKEMFLECEGPGMPDYQGRANIKWLSDGLKRIIQHSNSSYCQMGHDKMASSILRGDVTHL